MKPNQAISSITHDAVDLLERYQERGGDGSPVEMVRTLAAAAEALQTLADTYVAEINTPGLFAALSHDERNHLLAESHTAASAVLLVCSLMPGVDSLPSQVVH